jgi:capsular exopolysaccharide synthesis family protein
VGLTDLLRSPDPELGPYLKDTGVENLQVITSGPLPPNSSEMLGSRRMAELIQRLEQLADILIFDSPPVLAVTDAAVLSSRVDGVILVTQADRTRREAAKQAVMRLRQVGAHVLGATLNGVSGRNGSAYHYRYYTRSSASGPVMQGEPAAERLR